MARGMSMPRPPSNAGRSQQPRSQPPRRSNQSRDAVSGRLGQRLPGNDQIRQRQAELQRQAAVKQAATQQRLRQQQYLREAQGVRRREEARRQTAELAERVRRLARILESGLTRSAAIDLDALLAQPHGEDDQYNARITRIATGLRERDPKAVESFVRTVLRRVPLPAGLPRRAEARHDPIEERLTVRMVMPGPEVVPEVAEYECEPPRWEIKAVPRPEEEIEAIYQLVLGQVALLAVRDVFQAESQVETVSFEGLVDSVDPATGEPELSPVVAFTADRETFEELELDVLPLDEALHQLDAELTIDPYASQPV
jgi:restriction system protein